MIKLLLSCFAYAKSPRIACFQQKHRLGDATFLGIKVRSAEVIARWLIDYPAYPVAA